MRGIAIAPRQIGAGLVMALGLQPLAASATQSGPPEKSAAAPEVSGVTVTPEVKSSPLVNPASQFVRLHIPQSKSDQLARFRDPLCVSVQGLPSEFDAFIAKRVVDLAKQVRAPVASAADCVANVHVVVTPQPQALITDIAKRREILIGYHFPSQSEKLTTITRPIQAWYVTRVRDTNGQSWLEIDNNTPACPPSVYTGPACERPAGKAGSRLSNDMSAEVVHALIIADVGKLADGKIGAVADYIAVLSLAKWQNLEKCSHAVPTILNLMADACESEDRPEAATGVDVALLTGLYTVEAREMGSQQRMAIASRMQAELNKDAAK